MIACVNIPALPLQLLRKEYPDWLEFPMAVIDRDAPTGKILWVNQRAWDGCIRPGMRYGSGLSLASELRAAPVEAKVVEGALIECVQVLKEFSPAVEASTAHPGVLWLNASGLGKLYSSLEEWARRVEEALETLGYTATLVVGFDRFSVGALAMARHKKSVMRSAEQERRVLMSVPLERLNLDPKLLAGMQRLGVRLLGELLRLPRSKVAQRFGEAAERIYVEAREGATVPVQALNVRPDIDRSIELGYPERNAMRLLERVQRELPGLVGELLSQDDLLAELRFSFEMERAAGEKQAGWMNDAIKPSTPTLDEALILDLLRLKFEATPMRRGVTRVDLLVIPTRARRQQITLLAQCAKRDMAAADRALARLRAELGEESVGVVSVGDGHLPEARTVWTPIQNLRVASPDSPLVKPMIRRVSLPPIVLPPRPRHEPDGWLVRGPEEGRVVRSVGPHIVSGGWWATEIHREYHFLETSKGSLLWTFFDRRRRRWFLQGAVE
jgi:protein ImuB